VVVGIQVWSSIASACVSDEAHVQQLTGLVAFRSTLEPRLGDLSALAFDDVLGVLLGKARAGAGEQGRAQQEAGDPTPYVVLAVVHVHLRYPSGSCGAGSLGNLQRCGSVSPPMSPETATPGP